MSNFPLRLPPDLGEWVKGEATREGRSLNGYIVWLLKLVRNGQLKPCNSVPSDQPGGPHDH